MVFHIYDLHLFTKKSLAISIMNRWVLYVTCSLQICHMFLVAAIITDLYLLGTMISAFARKFPPVYRKKLSILIFASNITSLTIFPIIFEWIYATVTLSFLSVPLRAVSQFLSSLLQFFSIALYDSISKIAIMMEHTIATSPTSPAPALS